MIVCSKSRWCYLAIPKTASKSMHRHLQGRTYGGVSRGQYHSAVFQRPSPQWLIWSIVRHPYERLVSWWWFMCRSRRRKQRKDEVAKFGEMDLADFITHLIDHYHGQNVPDQPDQHKPQHHFLAISSVDRIVRLECLREEFDSLPFSAGDGGWIPRIKGSAERTSWEDGGKSWLDHYDQDALDLANEYGAAEEAEAFGYRPALRIEDVEDTSTRPVGPPRWRAGS